MDLYVDEAELEVLRRAIEALDDYTDDLNGQVAQQTRTFTNTPAYDRFLEHGHTLRRMLDEVDPPDRIAISEDQLRTLRSAVCHARRRAATTYDDAAPRCPIRPSSPTCASRCRTSTD